MPKSILVFASSHDGRFRPRGAALEALQNYGADPTLCRGMSGDSFAVPLFTKDNTPVAPDVVARELFSFFEFVEAHRDLHFDASRLDIPAPIHPAYAKLIRSHAGSPNLTLPTKLLRAIETHDAAPSTLAHPAPNRSKIHILVPDGTAILRRVYEANNQAATDIDRAVGAVRSSLYSIRRALLEHQPTHLIVAMDGGGRATFRHAAYPQYKADRPDCSPALKAAFNVFESMLRKAGIVTVRPISVEADDVIASIGHRAANKGIRCTVLSSDKDSIWLSSLGVNVYHHFDKIFHDDAYCLRKYGIPSSRFIDYLALLGDANDGIPGVPGVGAKTAKNLILQFPSIESIIDAAISGEIPGAKGMALRENRDALELSRFLALPKLDCDVGFQNLSETKMMVDPVTIWANLNPAEIQSAIEASAHDFHPEAQPLPATSKTPNKMKP